jgi:uncharacterized membrane protein
MILTGSIINAIATFAMMALLASKAPTVVALFVFFASPPLNIFLCAAVWRSAENATPLTSFAARLRAVLWLVAASLL